jgi:DNA modification methylase
MIATDKLLNNNVIETEIADKKQKFYQLLSSDLDFENDKNSVSRHSWHSFPAKFPPALPKYFIENLTKQDDLVLDPMSGSCTTILESIYLNRKGLGFDIDPLSLILGYAKLQNINKFDTRTFGNSVLNKATMDFINNKPKLEQELLNRFDKETIEFLDYWYSKDTQLELVSLISQIEKIDNKNSKDFLKLIFSSIIITKSGGVTLSYDLAHTRPHKVTDKKINSAFAEFNKKMTKILGNGYIDLPEKFELKEGNAKQMPIPDNTVDLIVTSPPYANNAIDYMRAHKFSLIWFEHSINQLKLTRKQYIGAETIIKEYINQLPEFTNSIVNQLKLVNKSKGNALERYYSEMQQVISEMYRVLKNGRACVIVVATSVLNSVDVQIDKCFKEIAEKVGFELIKIGERKIHRDKRMLPTSKNSNQSQIESRMHNEYVIGFWKN